MLHDQHSHFGNVAHMLLAVCDVVSPPIFLCIIHKVAVRAPIKMNVDTYDVFSRLIFLELFIR